MSQKPLDCVGLDPTRSLLGKSDLTLNQIDRIIANNDSGVQLTGVNVYRQLASVTRERDALKAALEDLLNRTKNFRHTGFPSMAHFQAFADAHITAGELIAKAETCAQGDGQ